MAGWMGIRVGGMLLQRDSLSTAERLEGYISWLAAAMVFDHCIVLEGVRTPLQNQGGQGEGDRSF
ncbi:MAG: hypothetical protein AAGD09_13965 [Cyanobacteria bacterium P01_F01_bin.56]